MARYIIMGCDTQHAVKSMVTSPVDRETAVRSLIEAVFLSTSVTTVPTDFLLTVETDDFEGVVAALLVIGASGTVRDLETVQAIPSVEVVAAQERVAKVVGSCPPGA